jgi:hypothetical protein
MPIQVEWLGDDKQILIERYIGSWTIEDFKSRTGVVNTMLDCVKHPVDIVLDVSRSGFPPLGIVAEAEKVIAQERRHPNMQRVIYAAPSAFMRMLLAAGRRTGGIKANFIYEFPSIEDAVSFIHENPTK